MSSVFTYRTRPASVEFVAEGDAAEAVSGALAELGITRALLISSVRELPRAHSLTAGAADRIAGEFTGVRQHVPAPVADAAGAAAEDARADGLLAIGGGSAIGAAKVVAHRTGLPIVAVPTTYSGSEMTATWGITENGHKMTAVDERVAPRAVVYDPALVADLPRSVAVPSAFNAMAHCVEALWVARANPIIDVVAIEGILALREGLDALDADPARSRQRLLYGAFLGGLALGSVGSGLHHKICHALGGAFDAPHAETHTVLLPHVLAFNEAAVPDTAARIAAALDAPDAAGGLRALVARAGAPSTLPELGVPADRLDEAVAAVVARLPVDNPATVGAAEIETILRGAFGLPSASRAIEGEDA
jgi:alcohol dehydrogenase class IV